MMTISFFKKRTMLVPTIWGWFLIICILLAITWSTLRFSHSFLSISRPVNGDILVVEGWIPDDAMVRAADLFKNSRYRFIVVTGGPLDLGSYLKEYENYAQLGVATLRELGIEDSLLVAVPAPFVSRDRTHMSAFALEEWLRADGASIRSLDLCSFDAHARRSVLLFRKVLGRNYKIGIIAQPDGSYDSSNWWHSSAGFRMVVGEMIAYMYAVVSSPLTVVH